MKKITFLIVLTVLVALISNAQAQEKAVHHIKNMESISTVVDLTTRDAIITSASSITQPSNSAGIIVIPPSDAGARKDIDFVRTRPLPAGSVVVPLITFPSGNVWKFNGFFINGDIQGPTIFHVLSIADFGNFWEQGAMVQIIVQLPGGAIETAQASLRAFRTAPSPIQKMIVPLVRDARWIFINGNAYVALDGSFVKDQTPEIFWGYTLLNPKAIIEVKNDRIVIDLKADPNVTYYNGISVITVMQIDPNSQKSTSSTTFFDKE